MGRWRFTIAIAPALMFSYCAEAALQNLPYHDDDQETPAAEEFVVWELAAADKAYLETMRDFGKRIEAARQSSATASEPLGVEDLQGMYDGGLAENITDQAYYEALAVAFGDELVRRGGLKWMILADQDGQVPVVAVPGKSVYASPIDMIFKRVERRENTDFEIMIANTLAALDEIAVESGVQSH